MAIDLKGLKAAIAVAIAALEKGKVSGYSYEMLADLDRVAELMEQTTNEIRSHHDGD